MDLDSIKQAIFCGDVRLINEFINDDPVLNKFVNGEPRAFYEILSSAINVNRDRLALDNADEIYDDLILRLIKAAKKVHLGLFDGNTILCSALDNHRSFKIIDELIKAGSDVNAASTYMTPLMNAVCVRNIRNIISELMTLGAEDVNYRDENGRTPLLYCMYDHYDCPDFIAMLLRAGSNVHDVDNKGKNILMTNECQCLYGHDCEAKESIDLLFKCGVNDAHLKHTDDNGNTILHLTDCKYVFDLAIKFDVSIEAKNDKGQTALLTVFLSMPYKQKFVYLLKLGADVHSTDSHLQTALHFCSFRRYNDVPFSALSMLIYHGGNLYAHNIYNKTPLDKIMERDSYELKCIILEHIILFDDNGCDVRKETLEKLSNSSNMNSHINECKKELNLMQETFIADGVTFYKFCILKRYFKSKCVNISFNEYKYSDSEVRQLFPVYYHIIIIRINDNRSKKRELDMRKMFDNICLRTVQTTETDLHEVLNYDCLYYISRFLSYEEMFNVFTAAVES